MRGSRRNPIWKLVSTFRVWSSTQNVKPAKAFPRPLPRFLSALSCAPHIPGKATALKIDGIPHRTIRFVENGAAVEVIDQTELPFRLMFRRLCSLEQFADAIRTMVVRGAPLIGATAACGIALSVREKSDDLSLSTAAETLRATRPTAVNLGWAIDRMLNILQPLPHARRPAAAMAEALAICDEDAEACRAIGRNGLALIEAIAARKAGRTVNILTHCNAGWLATVDFGTALAPIYAAHDAGLPVHVWVDETRPRNQGAALTAWEFGAHGVPHTVIADNAGGHLMQRGQVDLCIVGADRVSARGDAANKIGTYLKALAAHDTGVPFYVATPLSTIDLSIGDGLSGIPIEERDAGEVTHITGLDSSGTPMRVRIAAPGSPAANPAFDVTPARLVTALVTEKGVVKASPDGIRSLFAGSPER